MSVVVAVFSPLEGRRPELRAALRAGIAAAHAERGCLLYAIHDADDGTIVMIEKWESRADLDAHAEGAAIDGLRKDVAPFLANEVLVTTMTPLPEGTVEQGLLHHITT